MELDLFRAAHRHRLFLHAQPSVGRAERVIKFANDLYRTWTDLRLLQRVREGARARREPARVSQAAPTAEFRARAHWLPRLDL